jgi:hypothetical protein
MPDLSKPRSGVHTSRSDPRANEGVASAPSRPIRVITAADLPRPVPEHLRPQMERFKANHRRCLKAFSENPGLLQAMRAATFYRNASNPRISVLRGSAFDQPQARRVARLLHFAMARIKVRERRAICSGAPAHRGPTRDRRPARRRAVRRTSGSRGDPGSGDPDPPGPGSSAAWGGGHRARHFHLVPDPARCGAVYTSALLPREDRE